MQTWRKAGLALAIAVLAAAYGAASGSTETTQTKEPLTVSVLYNETAANPFSEEWPILAEIQKRKNVILKVQTGPDSDFLTKKNLVYNSGDIPDMVLKNWPNEIVQFATSGILLPVSDHAADMVNFSKLIAAWKLAPDLDDLRFSDGKYYLLPGFSPQAIQVQQWAYRKDLFDKHGLKAPASYDEMISSLVRLKELYPDSVPITARWNGQHLLNMMAASFNTHAGWGLRYYYNTVTKSWEYAPATDRFKELTRLANRMMSAGVLDKEAFTQDTTQYDQKILTGKALVTVDWVPQGMGGLNTRMQDAGVPGANWQPMHPPTSSLGITAVPGTSRFRVGTTMPSRLTADPRFAEKLAFVDWLFYSEEGMVLSNWGIEGLTYETVGGQRRLLPNIAHWRNPQGKDKLEATGAWMFYVNEEPTFLQYKTPEAILALFNEQAAKNMVPRAQPSLRLSDDDLEFIRISGTPLDDYAVTSQLRFIYGDLDIEKDWDAYVRNLEQRGYKELERRLNDAWKKQQGG